MKSIIAQGCDLKHALQIARRNGISVEPVRRTGEIRFSHPSQSRTLRCNGRRKDAPRELVAFLRDVIGA